MIRNSKWAKTVRFYFEKIDKPLLVAVVSLSAVSILNMYGVVGGESPVFKKHLVLLFIGIVVMFIFSLFNYRYFKNYPMPVIVLYVFSIILLGLTFYSKSIRGTNSWIIFGNLTFEPAEMTKLFLIILTAKYFSQKHVHIYQFRYIIASAVYFVIPGLLIINQPDLGSAIILGLIWIGLLIAAGISRKHLAILAVIAALVFYGAWAVILKSYQRERILSFLNQERDPLGSGYNLIQSKIAIGAGFWFGNGLGGGSQVNLGFLPEPHNDFIFSALAEQFGLIGVLAVLSLAFLAAYRILVIGYGATANFGKLFSVGMAVFIFSHVFISGGVNVGLLPITGLPFPFLSLGGSYLISVMAGLGILQSIRRYG